MDIGRGVQSNADPPARFAMAARSPCGPEQAVDEAIARIKKLLSE